MGAEPGGGRRLAARRGTGAAHPSPHACCAPPEFTAAAPVCRRRGPLLHAGSGGAWAGFSAATDQNSWDVAALALVRVRPASAAGYARASAVVWRSGAVGAAWAALPAVTAIPSRSISAPPDIAGARCKGGALRHAAHLCAASQRYAVVHRLGGRRRQRHPVRRGTERGRLGLREGCCSAGALATGKRVLPTRPPPVHLHIRPATPPARQVCAAAGAAMQPGGPRRRFLCGA